MTPINPRPSVVFFDYGDTLMRGQPPYFHRIAHALRGGGLPVEPEAVELAAHAADFACYQAWKAGGLEGEEAMLPMLLQHLLRYLELPPTAIADRPDIITHWREGERTRKLGLFDGALDVLERLRARGYRMAVVSNNDGTCAAKCEALGIHEYFEVIVDSAVEGIRKPDAAIFERACGYMDVEPAQAVHIGDMYGSDVCGAHEAGVHSIWMNFRRAPRPDHPIAPTAEVHDITDVLTCLP